MLDKINIRMDPPIDSKNCFSVLNVPNILITLIINFLKGYIQDRMSPEELATRFTINQISTTNLKYMGPISRADMLAKITLPKIKEKAIRMFMQIDDYQAIKSKDLFDMLVKNPDNADCLNELVNKNRRDELEALLPVNPNKEQAKAFVTIIDEIYDTGYFNRGSFSVKSVVQNPMQARALINAANSKYECVRKELAEKAELTEDNLAKLDDTNLRNFINEIGCIPFFTKYEGDNEMWGSVLERLDDKFIGNLISDNRHAFADNETTHTLLFRLTTAMHIREAINIDTFSNFLTPDADMEVYETCAVILNAFNDPKLGLKCTSDKQKNKLYQISLNMKLPRLRQALDGDQPESITTIREDLRTAAKNLSWVASSIGSWLNTGTQHKELDQKSDSDLLVMQGMMLAV